MFYVKSNALLPTNVLFASDRASSLGMMTDEEKKKARMEDIKILLGK